MTIQRINPNQRASDAVVCGDFFESAGIVAEDLHADITDQTRQVLRELEHLLAQAGFERNHLTRIQIWLSNMAHFDDMNAVYDAWVADFEKPGRATVESRLAHPGYLIEIQAFAYKG